MADELVDFSKCNLELGNPTSFLAADIVSAIDVALIRGEG